MLPSEYLAQGWCQGHSARNKMGNYILARDFRAKKWCFMGAMEASGLGRGAKGIVLWTSYRDKAQELLHLPVRSSLCADIPAWNDQPDRTQAEVVALAWRVEMALGLRLRDPQVEPGAEAELVVETETLLRDGNAPELAQVN